jgi:hypothetical protein
MHELREHTLEGNDALRLREQRSGRSPEGGGSSTEFNRSEGRFRVIQEPIRVKGNDIC